MIKPRIIFFGTPFFVVPVLKKLTENFDVAGVVTMPDSVQGRKKILTPTPVKKYAIENNVSVFESLDVSHWSLDINQIDLFVVAAFGKIISQKILDLPKYGAFNIHPSLLPKFRGPTPIQSAILEGEKISGVSIIKMDNKMDHGPIVSQWDYPISNEDTFESLSKQMFMDAAQKLPKIIQDYVEGKIEPVAQDDSRATYIKIITKEDGFIDISNLDKLSALEIKNLKLEIARKVRAFYPWPTAWTKINEKIVKFYPGEKIQMEGKNITGIKEFINGYPQYKNLILPLFYK